MVSTRVARAAGLGLLLLTLLAAGGVLRVWFSDDYREIFRTDRADFALLAEIGEQFGSDEDDVLVVLRGGDVVTAQAAHALAEVTAGLESIPGVVEVHSPTNVSGLLALAGGGDDPAEREVLRRAVAGHPLLGGRLVSRGLDAALVVARLDGSLRRLDEVQPVLDAIDAALAGVELDGLSLGRTGLPYIRSETVRSVKRDQRVFTVVGILLGALISRLTFRDHGLGLLVAAGPLAATLWTVGAMGWIGEPLNVINNVAPVLVLVIGMTDSVHFGREFQRLRLEGAAQRPAALAAVRRVAVPCALTSLTTILGFSSLALADVGIVRRFGLTCAGGLTLSLLAVLTVGPLLAGWTRMGSGRSRPATVTPRALGALFEAARRHSVAISVASGLFLLLAAGAAVGLSPDYRYREFLPASSPALRALTGIEDAFGGSHAIRIVVDWPPDADDPSVLEVLAEVEDAVARSPVTAAPTSLLAPLRALAGADRPASELPPPDLVPAPVRSRYWLPEARRALVEARASGLGAAGIEPHLDALAKALAFVAAAHPGFELRLNGLLPVSARTSLRMLDSLARSLAVAAFLIIATLCVAMRSLRLGLLSLIPNLLPLGAICVYLAASGRPLQFTSVTVLTIVLGLAVDDTIHVLAGFRRERRSGAGVEEAIRATLESVGGSLIVTSALLVAGFGAVGLSRAPFMSLFGWLAAGAVVVALLGDLFVLPALLRLAFLRRDPPDRSPLAEHGVGS